MTEPSPSATTRKLPSSPPCPFCDGEQTELVSTFGAHASVSTYWCRRCRSPFELLKWGRGSRPDGTASPTTPTEEAGEEDTEPPETDGGSTP